MLSQRTESILRLIVEDYIQSAEPIGSKALVDRYRLSVSSATVRNEMAFLEQTGFIRHPHTSAGRIPTESGYQYYLKNIVEKEPHSVRGAPFQSSFEEGDPIEVALKTLAQKLVEATGETAIVASDPPWSYRTGVANLFDKPDFHDFELVQALATMLDRMDELSATLLRELPDRPIVLIGSQSPFGDHVSSILLCYRFPDDRRGLLGLVGPLRMNYARNLALMNRVYALLEQTYE